MRFRNVYVAKKALRQCCKNCDQQIRAGQSYYRRALRGSRGADRFVEHVTCPSDSTTAPCQERIARRSPQEMRRAAIISAVDEHIRDGGLVTSPDRLADRIVAKLAKMR